jgi:hypothetical protein
MSHPEFLMFDPQALLKVRGAPAAEALSRKLVTKMDLLRLKAIARLQARGLPPEVGWSDLPLHVYWTARESPPRAYRWWLS